MSNALAIAGVTAVLKDLLNDGLINANMDTLGQFTVTAMPPDRLEPAEGNPPNRLNIYLWNATRNAAWSNERLPARSASGERLDSPWLALDLSYILTATGSEDLNAEILLGYGMQILHETPVLTRSAIRTSLGGGVPAVDAALLPPALQFLAAADLADQFEQIRITMMIPDPDRPKQIEAMSNIWSAFSAPLRASALYQVSCVLIESRRPVRSSLPVLTLGEQTAQLRGPRIERVRPLPLGPGSLPNAMAPVLPGSWLALEGTALSSDLMQVVLGARVLVVQPANIRDTRIDVQLPADVLSGLSRLAVEHMFLPPGGGAARLWEMSNAAPVVISPVIQAVAVTNRVVAAGLFSGRVTLTLTHPVGPTQTAALLFNPRPGSASTAFSVRCDPRAVAGTQISAALGAVLSDTYLIRAEIDGAASQLTMGAAGFDGPLAGLVP
ncbi:MAG: DUF4255 domain-containing protein [Cypionkella sp.]